MVYLNDDIVEVRRKLLNAVGKLNRALDYTGYKKGDRYIGLSMNEMSADELIDVTNLLVEAINLAADGNTMAKSIIFNIEPTIQSKTSAYHRPLLL